MIEHKEKREKDKGRPTSLEESASFLVSGIRGSVWFKKRKKEAMPTVTTSSYSVGIVLYALPRHSAARLVAPTALQYLKRIQ